MFKLKQLLSWFDIHGLFVLSAFLIVFIPLFPKIPIFDVLPGYIVRARPEDIIIFITALVWIKDAYKNRFQFKTTYFWLVVLYAISGGISIALATGLIQSIPAQLLHIGKSSLHLFRYLEYFALFFFTYSSVKTQKQLKIILALLAATIIGIVFYGFGQEYLQFPLYSTMNREYSKGVTLYLQEGARPQSTFAGHYDLAAYLVIVLPIIFSTALHLLKINLKNPKQILLEKSNYLSALLHIVHVFGAWMLVTSGSKTALLAYIAGVFVVLLFYLRKLGSFKQQLKWGSVAVLSLALTLWLFLSFFAQSTKTQLLSVIKNTLNSENIPNNPDARPEDLVGDGVVYKQITKTDPDGTQYTQWISEQSTWSQNALKYGLSMGIRLDTLWPNALKGFFNNPLFGNGYSTLAVIDEPGAYSNADSTDNNFLRTIGETGLFGFLLFYGFLFVLTIEIIKQKTTTPLVHALKAGFLGAVLGILINASYIDVFAASKVAYTFWAFAGITVALLKPNPTKSIRKIVLVISKNWPLLVTIIVAAFLLHKNPFHKYALIKDLYISPTQLETLTSAKCYIDTGSFTVCRNNGLVLKESTNLYSILLVPFLKIYDNPMMFYILNMSLLVIVLIGMYVVIHKFALKNSNIKPQSMIVFGSLVLYVIILTALSYTTKPLSTFELVLFLFILPCLLVLFTVLLHKTRFRLAYLTQIAASLTVLLLLVNQNYSNTFLTQFRNNQVSNRFLAINTMNVHFDTFSFLNRERDYSVISVLNPYYVDLFSNGNYEVIPISENQPYFANAESVFTGITSQDPLLNQYKQLLNTTNLYISNYGAAEDATLQTRFQELKQIFNLKYVAIGCEDDCSLFAIQPYKEYTSPVPKVINEKSLTTDQLTQEYSFTVIANRFEPKTQFDQNSPGYSTQNFVTFLNSAIPQRDAFAVITGDTASDDSATDEKLFSNIFKRLPLFYSSGNLDLTEKKLYKSTDSYFFTDSELFIFLNVNPESQISEQQKIFVYNILLELERQPEIKNIFVISHNLNWQDRTNPNNFIFDLERKLENFPNKNTFIITSHHSSSDDPETLRTELTAKHVTDTSSNINYLSSYVRDWENDSFFEFTVHADNTVTVQYRVKGENF